MDERLVKALDELEAAQEDLELAEGDIDGDPRLLRFHSAALDVAYRWREFNASPKKPKEGPFRMGVKFVLKEGGSTHLEPVDED